MPGLRFKMEDISVGESFRVRMEKERTKVAKAARLAMNEANRRILVAGREDIASGGNFGPRWTQGLEGAVTSDSRGGFVLQITHRVPYWKVFEFGTRIFGKPLLWIPLPWNKNKVRARDYPGQLFRVNRKGKNPLLMQRTGKTATALYVGVPSVKQKRRFHLRRIIRSVSKQLPALYRKAKRLTGAK